MQGPQRCAPEGEVHDSCESVNCLTRIAVDLRLTPSRHQYLTILSKTSGRSAMAFVPRTASRISRASSAPIE